MVWTSERIRRVLEANSVSEGDWQGGLTGSLVVEVDKLDFRRKMHIVVSTASRATEVDKRTGKIDIDDMGRVWVELGASILWVV